MIFLNRTAYLLKAARLVGGRQAVLGVDMFTRAFSRRVPSWGEQPVLPKKTEKQKKPNFFRQILEKGKGKLTRLRPVFGNKR